MKQAAFSEKELREAAGRAGQALLDSLPPPSACRQDFSPAFAERMEPLLALRPKQPFRRTALGRIAAAVLALLILGATLLATNEGARAALSRWWKHVRTDGIVEYRFTGDAPDSRTVPDYFPSWLPEGLTLEKVSNWDYYRNYYFTSETNWLEIQMLLGKPGDVLAVTPIGDYEKQIVRVSGNFAEYYSDTVSNSLIWLDTKSNVGFSLNGSYELDTLLKIAESLSIESASSK